MDTVDPTRRSANMSKVRSKDTGPELLVRSIAHRMGLRFRLYRRDMPGTPDLVFPRYKLAVFVHGCFWHRHPCCIRATTPSTRQEFWEKKFAATVERDARQTRALEDLGWRVLVLWECGLKDQAALRATLARAVEDADATTRRISHLGTLPPRGYRPSRTTPASRPTSRRQWGC